MTLTGRPADLRAGTFRHQATLYQGIDRFVDAILPFVQDGVDAGEQVLVVVDADRIDRLREGLGADAGRVRFADMARIGGNPARIIPAWRDFVADARGLPARGVGEPVWPGRAPAEMEECHLHESLLNVAFADGPPFWLVCPYDTAALHPDVIAEAGRTHPFVHMEGRPRRSDGYRGLPDVAAGFGAQLPTPGGPVETFRFELRTLTQLRAFVAQRGLRAGLGLARVQDLVLAANEAATNSLRHGGGRGVLRMWVQDDTVVCEVADGGSIDDPLVGRATPGPHGTGGRGLWLVNQLCDLVQVRSAGGTTTVRMHVGRARGAVA